MAPVLFLYTLLVFMSSVLPRSAKFSLKGHIVNILDFVVQETKLRLLSKVPPKASEAGPLVPSVIRETRNHLSVRLSSVLIKEVVITSLLKDLNHYSKSLIQHILYLERHFDPKSWGFSPLAM